MWLHRKRVSVRMTCRGLLFVAVGAAAQSQAAPAPGPGWLPLTQQGVVVDDPVDGNPSYLEIVGDKSAPAAQVTSDATYLYFRLRVAGSPYHTAVHHLYAELWACLLDTDQDPQSYELLAGLDGTVVPNTVDLDKNTATAVADDLGDAADSPPLATYDAALYADYSASGSILGGGTDFFVDWQVAWTDLDAGGLAKAAAFRLVCGTSTNAASLTGGDVLDGGSGTKSFAAAASDAVLCDDAGCRYDAVFTDGFEGK